MKSYILKLSIRRVLYLWFIPLLLWPKLASADTPTSDTLEAVAKAAQNPIANITIIPFQNNTSYGIGPYNRTQNVLNIEPVIPFQLNDNWNLITRTIVPIISQPKVMSPTGSTNGLGDINPTFFFSPRNHGTFMWGVGPSFFLPTATNRDLGSGKWSVGPGVVVVGSPGHWIIGSLLNNVWSVAGQSDRTHVSQLTFQPFINYNMAKGWYIGGSPIMTANWVADPDNRWTVPVGGGIGRIMSVGHQMYINVDAEVFYNVLTPDNSGSRISTRIELKLLFPSA